MHRSSYKTTTALIIGCMFLLPSAAQADTLASLRAQIASLMSMVQSLQAQLVEVSQQPATPWWCDAFDDVSFGAENNRVMALHNAMGSEVLGVAPTGYFGDITRRAWVRWCGTAPEPVDPQPCTREYRPVCGQPPMPTCPAGLACAQVMPAPQTYSNLCVMKNDGATLLYEGACKSNVEPFEPSVTCKSWYDGCNNCSRSTPGGPAMCTMRACFQNEPGYCKDDFEDDPASLTPLPVPCTADAKMCPDGSYVGRVAPNCAFAPCPGE